jgi:hypothetical protein
MQQNAKRLSQRSIGGSSCVSVPLQPLTAKYAGVWRDRSVPLQPLTTQRRRSMSSWIAISRSRCSCIRQHTSAHVSGGALCRPESLSVARGASAYVSIRQHTSAEALYVVLNRYQSLAVQLHTSAYVSIRQHTSAYIGGCGCNLYVLRIFKTIPHRFRHQYELAYMVVWGHIYISMRTHIY